MAATPSTIQEIHIDAERGMSRSWHTLWEARELVWLFARREIHLRYQHSFAGAGWALLQPLMTLIVLTVFQNFIGRNSKDEVPYPLYAMTGLVPWTFFGHALVLCSSSVLKYTSVIKKVHFPLLTLPGAVLLAATLDLLVALPLVALAMIYYGYPATVYLVLLPLFTAHLMIFAAALGVWMAVLNTRFRDTANALPLLMQLWFFLTPIAYSANQIPERWAMWVGLNPMLGILEGIRWSLFGVASTHLGEWIFMSWVVTLIALVSGIAVFQWQEETMAESI